MTQFDHLATYSDTVRPGITRLVFTERDMEARVYIKGLMKEAGLVVREDIMGNTFGRWEGSDPKAGRILACLITSLQWQGRQGTAHAYCREIRCTWVPLQVGCNACGGLAYISARVISHEARHSLEFEQICFHEVSVIVSMHCRYRHVWLAQRHCQAGRAL